MQNPHYFLLILVLFSTYPVFASYQAVFAESIQVNTSNNQTGKVKNQANAIRKNQQKSQKKEFLWTAFKTESFENPMIIRFSCDKKNLMNIALIDEGQPDFVKGWQAIVRLVTGNFPPSKKGYKKFIYTGRFMDDGKTLPIRKRDIKYFLAELDILRSEVFKNKEIGLQEYNEKIKHCNTLPKKQQQLCYNSGSSYQVKEPHIIVWITAEETKYPKGKYGVFDPKLLTNLKNLSCY